MIETGFACIGAFAIGGLIGHYFAKWILIPVMKEIISKRKF